MSLGLSCEKATMRWASDESTAGKLIVYGGSNGTSGNNYVIFDIRDGIHIPEQEIRYRRITLERLRIRGYVRSSADWFLGYGAYFVKEAGNITNARQFMDKYFLPNKDGNLYTVFKDGEGRKELLFHATGSEGGNGLPLDVEVLEQDLIVKDFNETELSTFVGVIFQSDVSQNQSYNIGVLAEFKVEQKL